MAVVALAQGAVAQEAQPPSWEKELQAKYTLGGYAILDNDVYSFGAVVSQPTSWMTETYVFTNCSWTGAHLSLDTKVKDDATTLRRMQLVTPSSPGYATLQSECQDRRWAKTAVKKAWADALRRLKELGQ